MLTVIYALSVEFVSLPFIVVEFFMDLLIILICWNLYLAQNTIVALKKEQNALRLTLVIHTALEQFVEVLCRVII